MLTANPPKLGEIFIIKLTNLTGLSIGVISFGVNELKPPQDLTSFGMPGCKLYTTPITNVPVGTRLGNTITLRVTVPTNPKLPGKAFFNQAFILNPPTNLLSVIVTNASKGVVGF